MQAAAGLQEELHTTRQSLNAVLQAEAEKAEELGTLRESSIISPAPVTTNEAEAAEAVELELREQRHCWVTI